MTDEARAVARQVLDTEPLYETREGSEVRIGNLVAAALSAARAEERAKDCRTCEHYLPIEDPTGREHDWCKNLRMECRHVGYRCGLWAIRARGQEGR